ncbi:VWA domain-containing protein [Pseudomaricurvus alkylphenolicus]|uniref:nitric oxide reductase activation protein NorD n=1 Tax=Pseudomaricurvus alkylphenolicus TaxID=1306991 RepID=UPI00141ED75C|nr:VWA domain-containing protein [Pseudomaricurvus alkylphenolicus]NIB38809.1 VWA domain-containing protein [Pseudomaricurvus alkylphenolicus]
MLTGTDSRGHDATSAGEPDSSSLHHYNLIASAVAGRAVTVHWHGSHKYRAYSDGRSIYLPALGTVEDRLDKNTADNERLSVIAQALLLRAGSLRRRWVQRLVGQRQLAERYLYAEICRAANAFAHLLPRRFTSAPALGAFPYRTQDSEDSLKLAGSRQSFPPIPDLIGTLRPVLLLTNNLADSAFAELTEKQQAGKMTFKPVDELDDDDKEDAEESKILKLFQNPLSSGGALSDMLNDILGAGRSGKPEDDPNAGGGAEMPVGGITQAKKKGLFATLTNMALDLISDDNHNDSGSQRYPEWDCHQQTYRDDWCLVDEMDPWCEEPLSTEAMRQILQPPSNALKRKLAGIGLSFENHRNQPDGEDLCLDRVIDYAVDYRMGTTPSEQLFEQSLKTRRDLGVMILLDISGSTGETDTDGDSIHNKQMRLAYQMLGALHELGDQVALYAYHSWGRTLIRLLRLKSFKEKRLDSRIHQRFSQLEPVGYTRTGAALRHAAHKLKTETGLPYRLLIVISDGFAYDQDYEGKYGEEDTRKALEEIRAEGTGCLCLTIASGQDEDKLASIFGAASTLAAADEEEMLGQLRPAVLKAIRQIKAS